MIVAIALGSNLDSPWGDSAATIAEAIRRLGDLGRVTAVSTLRSTEPVDYLDQPTFLNGVVLLDTALGAADLMQALLGIERSMGRQRDGIRSKGPRLIDLDLLLYDNTVLSTFELTLPHPRMHERTFVLEPLVEIAPAMVHPIFNTTVSDLLGRLREREESARSALV